ncbi:MAG TPA: hypothetical protein VFN67_05555 [Polyangiales bacterium]|nr:hypothetical protein [Polyangiales bacterium]
MTDAALIEHVHNLETGAAYRNCPELAVVHVRGDDRVAWLNGQLTNDIREIPAGQSVHALAVNVRGKIMAELFIADIGDGFLLLLHKQSVKALLESFERYIIMEDVTVEHSTSASVVYVHGTHPAAESASAELAAFAFAPLGLPGRAFVGDAARIEQLTSQLSAALPRIDDAAYEVLRLRRAVPRFGVDFDEHNYPQEVGLKALVSFKKGCYLGQEVVCTLENRGKLSRHLCVLEGAPDAPAPVTASAVTPAADSGSTTLTRASLYRSADAQGADAAGALTSAVWDPEQRKAQVLAYVRRAHAVPGATLFVGAQPLTLVRLVGEDSV